MRDLTLTQSARAARNAATLVQADAGSGPSRIQLYDTPGGILLATYRLAKPCGAVRPADGRIDLALGAETDLALATGGATWGTWLAGDGTVLAERPVTDETGRASTTGGLVDTGDVGPWVLLGTTGTQLYAGGIVMLLSGVVG